MISEPHLSTPNQESNVRSYGVTELWRLLWRKFKKINVMGIVGAIMGIMITVWDREFGSVFVMEDLDAIWHIKMEGYTLEMRKTIKFIAFTTILIKRLSRYLYLMSYILLFYAFWSGEKRFFLPWLVLSMTRCIVIELIDCFTGCVVCALFGELKQGCFVFVMIKAIYLAFSSFYWFQVYEFYKGKSSIVLREVNCFDLSGSDSSGSEDSLLAEAMYNWILGEAERCRRFDSETAMDEDVKRFEEQLAYRAGKVLNMKPHELIAFGMAMRESLKEIAIFNDVSTQTDLCDDEFPEISCISSTTLQRYPSFRDSAFSSDPLKSRFPYYNSEDMDMRTTDSHSKNQDEDLTMMRTRNVQVQTCLQIASQLSLDHSYEDLSDNQDIEDE